MSRRASSPSLSPGDIVYFMCLHLDTARRIEKHPHKASTFNYHLEGKARPMLVLNEPTLHERGKTWYRVLKITTKPCDARGKVKPGYQYIGNYVDPAQDSYVFCYPEWYPENLVYPDGGETKLLERMAFDNLVRIISAKTLRH